MIYHRCSKCFYLKKYPMNKNHQLHTDKEEFIVEVLDYGKEENESKDVKK